MIELLHKDCMELLKDTPDKFYDLAICDPPYGIDVKTRVFDDGKKWDNETPKQDYWNELFRVSNNQIVWGANYFLDYLGSTSCFLVWDKKMTEKHLMSMAELAWTSFDSKSLIFKQPPVGERGFYNIDGTRIHPTQKSIKLYEWLLLNYAKPNDNILDTHGGSMSIALAVHNVNQKEKMNLSLTLTELDEDYYNSGVKRYQNHIKQKTIFDL